MNKLSHQVYQRLVAQAEEARELKLNRLADNVLSSIGPISRDEEEFTFSHDQLKESVHQSLWKIAVDIVAYYDENKSDIQKIEMTLANLTEKVLAEIEGSLNVSNKIGPNEPLVFGQVKK